MKRLSCIVIGRNQMKTITLCFDSLFAAIAASKLVDYEVIYVDSLSTDGTVERIQQQYGDSVAVYQLTKAMNIAIGRNVGAARATGDVYFFLDGDMEVDSEFMRRVFSPEKGLGYDLVSGRLEEVLYNSKWEKYGYIEDRYDISVARLDTDLGGDFFIKANVFHAVHGFKNHMKQHSDMDMCYRLIRQGYQFWRLPYRITTHHTIHLVASYRRIFQLFWHRNMMFAGVLLRQNITSKYCWYKYCKQQRFLVVLAISLIAATIVHPACLLLYPLAVYFKYKNNPGNKYFQTLISTLLWCVSALAGLLFYYTKHVPEKDIIVIKR